MNTFNARLLAYILSPRLDNLIKLSFCLRSNSSGFVLVHCVLLKFIGILLCELRQQLPVESSLIREVMVNIWRVSAKLWGTGSLLNKNVS